jgi:preprotein translocase subunit SecG
MLMLTLNVVYVLIAIAIIAMVLMQRGSGAAAGSGFGAGASGTVFGARGASNFLSKSTKWLAITFFAISLFMSWNAAHRARPVVQENLGVMAEQPKAPASGELPKQSQPSTVPSAPLGVPSTAPSTVPSAPASSVPAQTAPVELENAPPKPAQPQPATPAQGG